MNFIIKYEKTYRIYMNCTYFGKCGSCTLYDKTYEDQLEYKFEREKEQIKRVKNAN